MNKMISEFKEFAIRGNVVDMAVGIVIGTAFGTITKSLVADVIMPPVGLLLGNVDFSNLFVVLKQGVGGGPYPTLEAAQQAGAVTMNIGLFVNTLISFLIVGVAMFLLVRGINNMYRQKEQTPEAAPTTKSCPHCMSVIPVKATRCPMCTSDIKDDAEG